jgi:hypothetical protein
MPQPNNRIKLIGTTFGFLTVTKDMGSVFGGKITWMQCRCVCGKEVLLRTYSFKNGNTKSCGCKTGEMLSKSSRKHGHSLTRGKSTKIYRVWANMIQRCHNTNNKHYHYYGGRGIHVCSRWRLFKNFLSDMGEPSEGLTIERVNNNLGYHPDNCVWATRSEQAFNRRPKNQPSIDCMLPSGAGADAGASASSSPPSFGA